MKKSLKKAPKRFLTTTLRGRLVSSDFFARHKFKILVAVALFMIYISTKYQCMTGMETISRLEQQVDVVKTERIQEKARYMSRIRESAMAQLADSIHPGLKVRSQPPYVLHY